MTNYDKQVTPGQIDEIAKLIDCVMRKGGSRHGKTEEFVRLTGPKGVLVASRRQYDSTLSWHVIGRRSEAVHLRTVRGRTVCTLANVRIDEQTLSMLSRLIGGMEVLPDGGTLFGYKHDGQVVALFDVMAHPLHHDRVYSTRAQLCDDYRVYLAEGAKLPEVFRTDDRAKAAGKIWMMCRSRDVLPLGKYIKRDTPGAGLVHQGKRVWIELDWGSPFLDVSYVLWDPASNKPELYPFTSSRDKLRNGPWPLSR